jgi:hypothetical protein
LENLSKNPKLKIWPPPTSPTYISAFSAYFKQRLLKFDDVRWMIPQQFVANFSLKDMARG